VEKNFGRTTLKTIVADITTLKVDAIVNAANSSLMGGGGVDGAIHRAGGREILEECKQIIKKIGKLPTGEAVITTAGKLNAKKVIHTVGPVWHGGNQNEPQLLSNCYQNSLSLAMENGLRTVAFPSISTGVYGYPVDKAARVSVKAVIDFIKKNQDVFEEVIFCAFDRGTEKEYGNTLSDIE